MVQGTNSALSPGNEWSREQMVQLPNYVECETRSPNIHKLKYSLKWPRQDHTIYRNDHTNPTADHFDHTNEHHMIGHHNNGDQGARQPHKALRLANLKSLA